MKEKQKSIKVSRQYLFKKILQIIGKKTTGGEQNKFLF